MPIGGPFDVVPIGTTIDLSKSTPIGNLTKPNLFQWGNFVLSSGKQSNFKIECEALTIKDWQCLASLIANKSPGFKKLLESQKVG
jgi:hypothetical protein